MAFWHGGFPPYVPAAERRARLATLIARLAETAAKNGKPLSPITIEGRRIDATFWGKDWCDNQEAYAAFAFPLGRGRTYVRCGAVVDLRIAGGRVEARVAGTELYDVEIGIAPLGGKRWKSLAGRCAGQVGSLVGLLEGALPDEVMRAVTDRKDG